VSELINHSGVRLFADRAQLVRVDFQITPKNAEAVRAICESLEGIPLALELAASWVQVLTPSQILERLEDRFTFLVTKRKDIPGRHRTLRAVLDYSFGMLPVELQDFLCKLSIFQSDWNIDAAKAVCSEPRAAEFLWQLQKRSLLNTRISGQDEC